MTEELLNAISSEDYLIGCIVKDYPFVVGLCNTLGFKGDYLDSATAKAIWISAETLFASGISVDAASIIETIEAEHRHIDSVGASSLVMKAITLANDPHKIMFHLKQIRDKFKRRNSISILMEGIDQLQDGEDIENITSQVKHRLVKMEQELSISSESRTNIRDNMRERFLTVRTRGTSGIKSRYPILQQHLASYQYGKLTVIGARPKVGKSTLALNEAIHASYNDRIPTAFFSIEMDEEELLEKAASDLTWMDNKKLKLGEFSKEQVDEFLSKGVDPILQCPLYVVEDADITVERICSKTRELVSEKGVKFVVIDYLQLIASTPGKRFQSRNYEVGHWTNTLRILAKETGVAIILLSQITRPPKGMNFQDANKADASSLPMPTMSDLKDSGNIEQDAYAIVLIGPSQTSNPQPSWMGIDSVCVRVEANRGGSTGDSEMMFNKPNNKFMSFSEYENHRKFIYSTKTNPVSKV